jgi:teichuronic acid exporter
MNQHEAPAPAGRALDLRLVESVALTATGKVVVQLVTWAGFLVVARILSPSDYGIIGMTTLYLGLVGVLTEFGIGAAIVNLRGLTAAQARQANSVSLLLGLAGFATSCAVAVPLSHFFRAAELRLVLPVMSLTCVLAAFRTVPLAILQRQLRFGVISALDAVQALIQAAVTIGAAAAGAGYWALVLGALAGHVTPAVAALVIYPVGFARPSLPELRQLLSFSTAAFGGSVSWYAYSNSDFAVAGRYLGKTALGAYSFAWTLATLPGDKMAQMLMRVMPAFFSAQQADLAANRRYLYIVSECLSMVVLPAAAAIAVLGGDFLHVAFGHKWDGALQPLMLLAIYAAMSAITIPLPQVLNALNMPRRSMRNGLLKLAVFPPAFYYSSRWGAEGIAATWLLLYPILTVPLYRDTLRALRMRLGDYARALWPGLTAAAAVLFAGGLLDLLLPSNVSPVARLGLGVALAGAAVVVTYGVAFRKRSRSYLNMVTEWARHRERQPRPDVSLADDEAGVGPAGVVLP